MELNVNLKNEVIDYGKCVSYSLSIPTEILKALKELAEENGFKNDKKFTNHLLLEILKANNKL